MYVYYLIIFSRLPHQIDRVQAAAADRDREPPAGLVLCHHGGQQEAAPAPAAEEQGPLPGGVQAGGALDVWPSGSEQRRRAVRPGAVRSGARPERALHQAVHRHVRPGPGQHDRPAGVVPVLREDGPTLRSGAEAAGK